LSHESCDLAYLLLRHTLRCCAAQKSTRKLLTGRTIMQFSCVCSSIKSHTVFCGKMPANIITSYPKFHFNHARLSKIWTFENLPSSFVCFLLVYYFFLSRYESCHKTPIHYLITLKFGTLKGGIKAHPNTKFSYNNINNHKVINNYLWKWHQYMYVVIPTG